MKREYNPEQTEYWLQKYGLRNYFESSDFNFYLQHYEKGEYLSSPDQPLDDILFLTEGSVKIYGIRDDGNIIPVNHLAAPSLHGDIEFSNHGKTFFYTEAKTPVTCVSLSVKQYRNQLNHDLKFLHLLLRSYAEKFRIASDIDTPAMPLEERLLIYMKTQCPSGELTGIENTLLKLRCSRRQLQRVLKKLCTEKKVVKTGKGRYKLIE